MDHWLLLEISVIQQKLDLTKVSVSDATSIVTALLTFFVVIYNFLQIREMTKMRRWQSVPALRMIEEHHDISLLIEQTEIDGEFVLEIRSGEDGQFVLFKIINVGAGICFDISIVWEVKVEEQPVRREPFDLKISEMNFAVTETSISIHTDRARQLIVPRQKAVSETKVGVRGSISEFIELEVPLGIIGSLLAIYLFQRSHPNSHQTNIPKIMVSVTGKDIYQHRHTLTESIGADVYKIEELGGKLQITWNIQ